MAQRQQGTRKPVAIIDAGSSLAEAEELALQVMDGDVADAPMLVLVTDQDVHGMIPVALRSLFVTALARPVDAAALGAALIAGGRTRGRRARGRRNPCQQPRKLAVLVAEDNRTNQMVICQDPGAGRPRRSISSTMAKRRSMR